MNNLLDTMFIKRFCLPLNVSIGDDRITINNCLCGPFNHVACVLQNKHCFKQDKRIKLRS